MEEAVAVAVTEVPPEMPAPFEPASQAASPDPAAIEPEPIIVEPEPEKVPELAATSPDAEDEPDTFVAQAEMAAEPERPKRAGWWQRIVR